MKRGVFITFEGGEGGGKSTQIRLLGEALARAGHPAVLTGEPGGTPLGEEIRRILLSPASGAIDPSAELLLVAAARAQHISQIIQPALDAGQVVLCDRFIDSTIAYQGAARGLGATLVRDLHRTTCRDLWPDLTLLLDIDPECGLARARRRNRAASAAGTRFDDHDLEFHRAVRSAFLQLASAEPGRIHVIDATPSETAVQKQISPIAAHALRADLSKQVEEKR